MVLDGAGGRDSTTTLHTSMRTTRAQRARAAHTRERNDMTLSSPPGAGSAARRRGRGGEGAVDGGPAGQGWSTCPRLSKGHAYRPTIHLRGAPTERRGPVREGGEGPRDGGGEEGEALNE